MDKVIEYHEMLESMRSSTTLTMLFPDNEHNVLAKRLSQNKVIYTTRVSSEYNKYNLNEIYLTNIPEDDELTYQVKVIDIKSYTDTYQHPFIGELTNHHRDAIARCLKYQVLTLRKI